MVLFAAFGENNVLMLVLIYSDIFISNLHLGVLLMYDIIIIGAGISGASFAHQIGEHGKTLLIEANEDIDIRTNVFPEHNREYLNEISMENEEIFPCDHIKTRYFHKEIEGGINASEFGKPLGKIVYTERLLNEFIKQFEDEGGVAKFNERVKKVQKKSDKVDIYTDKGKTYSGKLLILATGSRGLELQKSLGFETPDSYMGIYTHLYGPESRINQNFDFDYMFHLNPNIGKNGPFFFNVGKDRVLTGFLGNPGDSEVQCIDKLDRILHNYKYIQRNIEGLEWDKSEFITGEISKHPISKFTQDRVMVLGEAAGLVTAFFYEGLFSGLVSANLAAKTIKPLLSNNSKFTNNELKKYQQDVHRILLEKYYKNGEGFEHIFFNSSSSQINKMWKTYIEFVNESKRLRRNIWEAHRAPPEEYDIEKDKWAGRQLFNKLSFSDKISLGSKFLSALMKIY